MDIDLLERCRSRDPHAFRGLVSLWGDQALAVAARAASDRGTAEAAVRDAFLAAWRALPTLHSEHAFRPWLMRMVVRAAVPEGAPADAAASAIVTARTTDQTDRAVRMILQDVKPAPLRQTFFDDEIARKLVSEHALQVRREIAVEPTVVWAVLADPHALHAWTSVKDARVRPPVALSAGTRIMARGAIADKRKSRDETLVTRSEEARLLTWTTRSRIAPIPAAIEFRWIISLRTRDAGCIADHRLLGTAFPPGPLGRALEKLYAKVHGSMTGSMHRGIERLAALVEQRAHR